MKTIPVQAAWKLPAHCGPFGSTLVEDDFSSRTYLRLGSRLSRQMFSHDLVAVCGGRCLTPKRHWAQERGGPCSTTHWPFTMQLGPLGLGYLICEWDRGQRNLIRRSLRSFQALIYNAPAHSP